VVTKEGFVQVLFDVEINTKELQENTKILDCELEFLIEGNVTII
jgi:hypothetical protein